MMKSLKEGKGMLWIALALMIVAAAMMLMQGNGQSSTSASQTEKRVAEVLSTIAGAGKVEVALFYEQTQTDSFTAASVQKPSGAVVVAQGADDMAVRLSLIRAVKTLLNLSETAVDVFVMEDGR
ncbi:MAG: hypothetical protein GX096_10590 [Clostridiales bacterium]|nr:hypothetical protein [Clostridiales bacterium]